MLDAAGMQLLRRDHRSALHIPLDVQDLVQSLWRLDIVRLTSLQKSTVMRNAGRAKQRLLLSLHVCLSWKSLCIVKEYSRVRRGRRFAEETQLIAELQEIFLLANGTRSLSSGHRSPA